MRIGDNALALRRLPFRDTSWIVTLLMPGYGLIPAMARGARRGGRDGARAAFSGFHLLEVELRARGPEAMGTVSRVEIVRARHHLPFMAAAAAAAQLLIEVVHRFGMPGDPGDGAVFHGLDSALDALDAGVDPLVVVAGSLGRLLGLFGHGWRAGDCVGCGRREDLRYFSVRRGGVVCASCGFPHAQRLPEVTSAVLGAMNDRAWPPAMVGLSRNELTLLYRLGMAGLTRIDPRALAAEAPFRRLMDLAD
ncbi:MAG: DNA repair protein RecO [Magnetococcales bacterium]|nr:DNA repair protein RecO [Magnetococcales bacterium]